MIGKITTVYGVKGWVKIYSFTEPMSNLLNYSEFKYGKGGNWQSITFDEARVHGKGIIAHIAGVDDRDAARRYCDNDLAVEEVALPPLEDEEYYWHQLQGLKVYSHFGGAEVLLGKVDHLLETGANDVLVVRKCAGSIDARERLIPYVPGQFVGEIDLAAGRMDVDWDPEF